MVRINVCTSKEDELSAVCVFMCQEVTLCVLRENLFAWEMGGGGICPLMWLVKPVFLFLLMWSAKYVRRLFSFFRLFLCPPKGYSDPWTALRHAELALLLCKHILLGNSGESIVTSASLMMFSICSLLPSALYLALPPPLFQIALLPSP